jgi:hypothetical protein
MSHDNRGNPFAPIKVGDGVLKPIDDSATCERCGGTHKQFRLMDPVHGPVYSELCPKLGMFDIGVAEVKPLGVPSALCFYIGYEFGDTKATKG